MHKVVSAAVLTVAMLSGCMSGVEKGNAPRVAEATARDGLREGRPLEDQLLEIARTYESYGPLDCTTYRWAPPCAILSPVAPLHPTQLALSRSTDDGTHGYKLYSVFAKERGTYFETDRPSPVGQAVVKETWVPEEVKDDGKPQEPVRHKVKVRHGDTFVEQEDSFLPYARKDGHLYHAKEKGPLFVMFKLDPTTPGTDQGWVYGTVTADGKTVTAVGKIESCMKCHKDAPHDRLFGLPEKQ